jgi:flagellar biogenesis protein FliO
VRRAGQRRRALRVLETVGMGEKRFVAIVQVEEARFLIGGGSAGVSLLARLDREREFAAILDEQAAASASLPSLAATADRVEAAAQPVSTKVAW